MGNRIRIYPPLSLTTFLVFLLFFALIAPIFFAFFMSTIALAFVKLSLPPRVAFFLLFLSLIGSVINIPVCEMGPEKSFEIEERPFFFGMRYHVPEAYGRRTVIAVNFGGAIVPVSVAIYEFFRLASSGQYSIIIRSLICIAIAAAIFNRLAKPIRGVGIALPFFLPPLISAVLALTIGRQDPVVVAYLTGTLGTLIGADLLNLKKIRDLGAPMASIGGAGTFDGIFLSGVVAALLVRS